MFAALKIHFDIHSVKTRNQWHNFSTLIIAQKHVKIYKLTGVLEEANVKNYFYTKKAPAESSAGATSPHDRA